VQVDLARINPAGVAMDADPQTVIGVLREMKAAGKGVIGMKILGAGKLRNNRMRPCSSPIARLCGIAHHRQRKPRRAGRLD